jgi:hypothetical protein
MSYELVPYLKRSNEESQPEYIALQFLQPFLI